MVRYDCVRNSDITSLYSGGMKVADYPPEKSTEELFYWPYLVKPDMNRIAMIGTEHMALDKIIPEGIDLNIIYPETSWYDLLNLAFIPDSGRVIRNDPIGFLKSNIIKYDAIIVNRGALVSLSGKRLETEYFINLCRDNLNTGGLLCFNVQAYHGNWRKDLTTRLAGLYNLISNKFPDIDFIPGDNLMIMAGQSIDLTPDTILSRYQSMNIESPIFNQRYIRSKLNPFNKSHFQESLETTTRKADPQDIGYGLSYYLSQTGSNMLMSLEQWRNYYYITILSLILLTIALGKFRIVINVSHLNILYFGSISLAIELVAMYKIQMIGGYLYIILGILIGLFMIGMAGGSYLGSLLMKSHNLPKTLVRWLNITLGIMICLSLLTAIVQSNQVILLIIIGLAGFSGGMGYAIGSLKSDSQAGIPYGIDLMGGIIGTLIGLGILFGELRIGHYFLAMAIIGIILLANKQAFIEVLVRTGRLIRHT